MEIKTILPNDSLFHLFTEFPQSLYDTKVLELKKAESFSELNLISCFVLLKNEKVQARAALYQNPDLFFKGKKTAFLGHYECVEDETISSFFLKHINEKAKDLGAGFLIGPMNGSTWENYRFSLDQDYPNFFLEPYHHLYYNQQFLNAGFQSIGDYHSLLDKDVEFKIPGALEKQKMYEAQGVRFRNINLENLEADLEAIHDLNAVAFQTNYLYTPLAKKIFVQKYKSAERFLQPEFVLLAFSPDNQLIAYYFCIQDFYNTQEKSLIIKSIARHPDPKWRGLGQAIGFQIYERAKSQGFTSVIHAFMYDEGTSSPLSQHFSTNNFKKYRLYGQAL